MKPSPNYRTRIADGTQTAWPRVGRDDVDARTGDDIMQTKWMLLTLAALLGFGSDARAQQPTATDVTHELRLIASQPTVADADRERVRMFLDRPEVQRAAESIGLDLTRTTDHVSTLSEAEAAELAARIDALPGEPQVGGQVIVISASAVIIALLILLLLSD
jgi:hypothetical protein